MNDNLFEQIQSWSIATGLSIKNISEDELIEAQNLLAKENNLSTKQLAVINDILSKKTKNEKYYIRAQKAYAVYIKNLISIFSDCIKDSDTLEYIDILNDINASFIRCFIYKKFNNDICNQTINNVYDFILQYKYSQNIILNDTIVCFLLLTKDDRQFQEVLSIYYNELFRRSDYNLLAWIFDKNNYYSLFNTRYLFNTHEGKNNLKNIIQDARNKILNSDKLESLKALARDSFLDQYDGIYNNNNGFCVPIPDWVNNILNDRDKNILNNYYSNMPTFYNVEQCDVVIDSVSKKTLERIKISNNLEEIILLIIFMNIDEFIKININIWECVNGPGSIIVEPVKSITGEVEYNNTEKIQYSKLDVLYRKMFDAIPNTLLSTDTIVNLIKKWSIVRHEFHDRIEQYLTSVLHSDTQDWQRQANINQIVLLVEQILLSLDPNKNKKLTGNHGFAELKGDHFEKLVRRLIRNADNDNEGRFLLRAFRDHRNKIAHGDTYQEFGNCYFILVGIIKVFYMNPSDFNLSNE